MRNIIFTTIFALNMSLATTLFAAELQCPTGDQLKKLWSPAQIAHTESFDNQSIFYLHPNNYGTNTTWYVNVVVHDGDVDRALSKATVGVNQSHFVVGGESGFGFYSCAYSTVPAVEIFALTNTH